MTSTHSKLCTKKLFDNFKHAHGGALYYGFIYGYKYDTYYCKQCMHWHLTTLKEK